MKLTAPAGKGGVNRSHDVKLVQECLAQVRVQTRMGRKPLWTKRVDGRNSRDLEEAICTLQAMKCRPSTGRIAPYDPVWRELCHILPRGFVSRRTSVAGTAARIVRPQGSSATAAAGKSRAFAGADAMERKGPFPGAECRALGRAFRSAGQELGLAPQVKQASIRADGRFYAALAIDETIEGDTGGVLTVFGRMRRWITQGGHWTLTGKPADLTFRSRVYPALTGAREVTADQLALLGLNTRPADKLTRQVLAGCARMIADASITTEAGKKDHAALVLALRGLAPQTAQQAEEAVLPGTISSSRRKKRSGLWWRGWRRQRPVMPKSCAP